MVILVNNEGVTKEDGKPEVLDPAFTAEVMLRLPFRPDQTTEIISGERLSIGQDASGSYLKTTVPAGDIKVLAIGRGK